MDELQQAVDILKKNSSTLSGVAIRALQSDVDCSNVRIHYPKGLYLDVLKLLKMPETKLELIIKDTRSTVFKKGQGKNFIVVNIRSEDK